MLPTLRSSSVLLLVLTLAPAAAAQPGGMGGDGHHEVIQSLIDGHAAITRRVVDLPDGVETWTESNDPEMAALIRTHVRQMNDRLTAGRPVRRWDPLFAAIFERHADITMTMTDTERGIHVVETSPVPEVAALIRQHAHRAVSEFVAEGRARYDRPTPLPGEPDPPAGARGHGEMRGGGMRGAGMRHDASGSGSHAMHAEAPASVTALPSFSAERVVSAPLVTTPGVRVVAFAFRSGQTIGAHAAEEDAFLVVTEGRLRVVVGDEPHDVEAAGLSLPGGVLHSIEALTDARAVLVRTP